MSRVVNVIFFVIESLFFGGFTIFAVWVVLNHGPLAMRIGFSIILAFVIGQAFVIADKIIGSEHR